MLINRRAKVDADSFIILGGDIRNSTNKLNQTVNDIVHTLTIGMCG